MFEITNHAFRARRTGYLALSGALLFVAPSCDSDGSDNTSATDGSGAGAAEGGGAGTGTGNGGAGAGTGGAGGTGGDSTGAGGGTPDPNRPNVGFVAITSDTQPAKTRANATFLAAGSAYVCDNTPFGACSFFQCSPRGGGPPGQPLPNPGVIDVTGGSSALTFTPGTDGGYETIVRQTSLWSGGETLHVHGAGASIPAFDGTITAPARTVVDSPVPPAGDWTVQRSEALTFSWSGAGTARVLVEIDNIEQEDPIGVECDFAGSAGTGTIPAAALALLPAGFGFYSVTVRDATHVPAGEWDVTLRADSSARTAADEQFVGSAVIE